MEYITVMKDGVSKKVEKISEKDYVANGWIVVKTIENTTNPYAKSNYVPRPPRA